MTNNSLLTRVAEVYGWLESQIRQNSDSAGVCEACGRCCDFENFDHRLFITTPELTYLLAKIGDKNIKPMTGSRCPYQERDKCTVYAYRFAGCRIFCCKGNRDFQSGLSEAALEKFKLICTEFKIPYRYADVATMLNSHLGLISVDRQRDIADRIA
jgi:Fe-S-cluster containining protein